MASLLIRNLDETVKSRLRVRAAENDRSMEEEARVILSNAVEEDYAQKGLGSAIHGLFAAEEGFDLPAPDRSELPRDRDFDS